MMDAERRIYHAREKEHAEANPYPDANRHKSHLILAVELDDEKFQKYTL